MVTDVMDPLLSVAKLTEQGFKVEFGQQTHEQQEQWHLCGFAAKIWHLVDTDGQVRRKVQGREPCDTVEDS